MARSEIGASKVSDEPGDRSPGWKTRDILRTLAVIAGFYIALQLLWVGRSIALLTFLGVLFGVALTAGVDWLERRRVPRGPGAVLIVLVFLGMLAGLGALTAPSITGQLRELKTQLPAAVGKIQRWVKERQEGVTEVLEQVSPEAAGGGAGQAGGDTAGGKGEQRGQPEQAQPRQGQIDKSAGEEKQPSLGQGIADQIGGAARHLFGFASSTLSVLGGLLLILFVAIFVAIDAETYQVGLMHLFPHKARRRAREVLSATAGMLRRWLLTQFVSMVLVGVLTAGYFLSWASRLPWRLA